MSHFCVIVIGENAEEQLAPYGEFGATEDERYAVDIDCTEDYRNDWRNASDKSVTSMTFRQWAEEYASCPVIGKTDVPDISGDHKFGYITVDENGDVHTIIRRTNPNGKWDWYTEGGRWDGYFLRYDGSCTNSAQLKDIDFAKMVQRCLHGELEMYSRIHGIFRKHPPFLSFDELRAANADATIDEVREKYTTQPAIAEMYENVKIFPRSHEPYITNNVLGFVNDVAGRAVFPYAYIKDGKWCARGEMGWFGISTPHMTDSEWNTTVSKLVSSLPADTLLTVFDCHC